MSLHTIFGDLAAEPLGMIAPPPPYLRSLLERSALRLMSSELIIEDSHRPFELPVREIPAPVIRGDTTRQLVDPIIKSIGEDGFAPHFHRLIRAFAIAHVMATHPEAGVAGLDMILGDKTYAFLMTDKGGPAIQNWQSCSFEENGRRYLKVNKLWAINGASFDIAVVAVRGGQSAFPVPATFFLAPEHAAKLKKTPAGRPFLGGVLQLGNVSGVVEVNDANHLKGGRASDAERGLDTARMNFVRALMRHVLWLQRRGRVSLDDNLIEAVQYLYDAGTAISRETAYTNLTTMRVKALKFASNELMAEIVALGLVAEMDDQRDLLGFSKMEGSSYFCLTRLYGHLHNAKRVETLKVAA